MAPLGAQFLCAQGGTHREVSRALPGRAALPHGTRAALTTALKPTLSPACPSAPTMGPGRSHLWPPAEVATGKHLPLPPSPAKPSNLL